MRRIADQSLFRALLRVYRVKESGRAMNELCAVIMGRFFFPQWRAALLPGRTPVTNVAHPLDDGIPFEPGRVKTYLDFVPSWIRMVGFLFEHFGRSALDSVLDFIVTMTDLYRFAADVYRVNFSTTRRPRYLGSFRFCVIHLTDPHLMCVPSLHVMIVIRTWTKFRAILAGLGGDARFREQIDEVFRRALDITEAVLCVKQHSLICVSAAIYAMTRFDGSLFGEAEAELFVSRLFSLPGSPRNGAELRECIMAGYRRFAAAARPGDDWRTPLLDFLRDAAPDRAS